MFCSIRHLRIAGDRQAAAADFPRAAHTRIVPHEEAIDNRRNSLYAVDGFFIDLRQRESGLRGEPMENDEGRCLRVISDLVRFGCGYRTQDGKRQYFAWHGYPNRDFDYFTTSEISAREYDEICREYPKQISADRERAELFRNKYVEGHPVLLEGWDKLL